MSSHRLDSLIQQHELSCTSLRCLELPSLCAEWIFFCKHHHLLPYIICNVLITDLLPKYLCLEFLVSWTITRESFGFVRDGKASFHSSLQGPQNFISSGSSGVNWIQIQNTFTLYFKFMSISCTDYHSLFNTGISNLTNDLSAGYMNYHPIFECTVFIFILDC